MYYLLNRKNINGLMVMMLKYQKKLNMKNTNLNNFELKHDEYHPDRRVSFGRYAGKKYREIPLDYLKWFSRNAFHQMVNRKNWAIK